MTTHAERDGNGGSCGIRHAADNPGINQSDKGDKEADSRHNCGFEALGDRLEYGGAEAGEHQHGHNKTGDNHQAHNICPRQPGGGCDCGRQQRVHAQSRRHRERLFSNDAHEDSHHAGDECGDRSNLRHAKDISRRVCAGADHQGVEDDDVTHSEERGETATNLG